MRRRRLEAGTVSTILSFHRKKPEIGGDPKRAIRIANNGGDLGSWERCRMEGTAAIAGDALCGYRPRGCQASAETVMALMVLAGSPSAVGEVTDAMSLYGIKAIEAADPDLAVDAASTTVLMGEVAER